MGKLRKGFKVNGTKLLDANGNAFVMRGINHQHTWDKDLLSTAIPAIAKTGSNTIRIAFSNGDQWEYDDINMIRDSISLSEANKMVAILEVHDATGSNNLKMLNNAVDYWIKNKSALIGHEDTVILNIANEWYGDWGESEWADAYKAAIPKLRNEGFKHTILVDCSGWGQYPKSIHNFGKQVFLSDPQANTMFAIHMYEYAGGTASKVKENIDGVLNKGLALSITEFGFKHIDGEVDEKAIMQYCEECNVGYLGWSWKGNTAPVEYLDLSNDWEGRNLSSWGDILINGDNGIRQTSRICSVFK